MTVSRVVTGRGYVSPETREKVREAIRELGYLPNHQARGLRSRRSGTLAVIVSDMTNPYFTTLARGVEDEAKSRGALLLLASSDESEEEEVRCMRMVLEKGVDGVVLVPSHTGEAALALAKERGVPAVAVDRRGPEGFDCVRCDSFGGAGQLAELLASHGHRRAGILAGEKGISTSTDRVAGFSAVFTAQGGVAEAVRGPLAVESGQEMTLRLLRSQEPPTCLFAVNNFLAIGALKALAEAGLRVPEDLSVAGFDDLPTSMLAFPFLTVAHQPAREMGTLACQRLYHQMADPGGPVEEIILPTSLQIRSSVGPAPRA
jgi:LacI family transcriptional regulator